MKIALCDDDLGDLSTLGEYCQQYNPNLSVENFLSAKHLLMAFEERFYDIVFLDIEMDPPNGYEVAVQLMKQQQKPLIIFTTQTLNYAVRGYGIAFRYLPKPITYEQFANTLQLAMRIAAPQKIHIPYHGGEKIVSVAHIVYIEVLRHQILIHLDSNEILESRGTLIELIDQISDAYFFQPHKSYCVNLDYLDRIESNQIILTTGTELPLSRSKKRSFSTQVKNYLRGT
jgi:DNA-binding LytR/AlgR family response regulator